MKDKHAIAHAAMGLPELPFLKELQLENCIRLDKEAPENTTPDFFFEDALNRLRIGNLPYTQSGGLLELRQLIAKYLHDRLGLPACQADEILVSSGSAQALDTALRSLLEPEDEVIVFEPAHISYAPLIRLAGATAVPVRLDANEGFRLDAQAVQEAITPKTKAIIINSPSNPVGAVAERQDLEALADIIRGMEIYVVCDEPYAEFTYNGRRHISFSSLSGMKERTIVISGFSKAFAMPGWRLGYAAGNRQIINVMTKMQALTIRCAPTPAQVVGVAALERGFADDWKGVRSMVDELDRRRRFMVDTFNDIGLLCAEPEGALYTFPSIRSTGLSSSEFCARLLKEQNVAAVPGVAFGPSGEGFIRCSYVAEFEQIREALERTKHFIAGL